ncbi:MAG TPA: polysaccharide deacetylase family protein [Candidatus Babeliales bacterium]|nr:polysaccharide deacetylase family protein [Candidatus Babeliales bacterium]
MSVKSVYLTIDDAPSKCMDEKIDFLLRYKIPALFFCRGEFIQKNNEQVVYAIKKGFLIGNHSYSHPYFSTISFEQCVEEITKTEELINQCYNQANSTRSAKVIRVPFGDRGAGPCFKHPKTTVESIKVDKIQHFLKEQGFCPVLFGDMKSDFIDASWDWDPQDYKRELIADVLQYEKNLKEFQQGSEKEECVLLLHDFDFNHHLFKITMDFLLRMNIQFLSMKT